MKTGRTYTTAMPGKISGRLAVCDQTGTVNFIPALRWLGAKEITRKAAADFLRENRRDMRLRARPAYDHELR